MADQCAQKKNFVHQAVFTDIIRRIYDYDSLITEKSLIEKYHVSKSPVREALIELCNEGILSSIPRSGYRIAPLNQKELLDALKVRSLIELAALDISFTHMTDAQINVIEANATSAHTEIATADPFRRWLTNKKFHTSLCALSGNKYMVSTLEAMMKICLRGAPEYFGSSWDRDISPAQAKKGRHFLLLDALRERNLREAKEVLLSDINDYQSAFAL